MAKMKTEQEKYIDALHKALDLKNALDDLTDESKMRLLKELCEIAGMQQYIHYLQNHIT